MRVFRGGFNLGFKVAWIRQGAAPMAALTQLILAVAILVFRIWRFASSIGKFANYSFNGLHSLATMAANLHAFASVATVARHPGTQVGAAACRAG